VIKLLQRFALVLMTDSAQQAKTQTTRQLATQCSNAAMQQCSNAATHHQTISSPSVQFQAKDSIQKSKSSSNE
jgi:hypothetical protein